MKPIYIIVWEGRDADSEIWDIYPVWRFGYFTDEEAVKKKVEALNKAHPGEYDPDAEAEEKYDYKTVEAHK